MLIAEGLKKNYISKIKKGFFRSDTKMIEAVQGLDLEIQPGKIVGLLGINGAGKTTTIKMLSTLLEPDSGKGTIDGMDLVKDARRIKFIINMIAGGERMIYWRLTARENLQYFGRLYNISEKSLDQRINHLIRFVGLEEKADEAVERYSKGMKQRLQIARGLINNPKYIFMDEPTLGLDAHIARDLRKFTRKLALEEGKGILLTSHYMKEIEELCDYVYIIDKGKKIIEGSPKEVTQTTIKAANKYLIRINGFPDRLKTDLETFLDAFHSTYRLERAEECFEMEVSSHKDIQGELISLLSRQSKIISFNCQEPSLEDALIKLSEVS